MRALRAKNVLTCQRALRAYVLTCIRALCAYLLTCQRALRAYVFTYQCVFCAYVLTCQCALHAYVLMSKRTILNNVNSYIIQICYLYLGLKRRNVGETLVSLLETFTSSSVAFRSLGVLKVFGEKNLGNIGIAVMPRLCCPVFHFHQFLNNANDTFGKNYFRIASQLRMTNSGGLMLACR